MACQVDMIAFLPHYLEGLFGILASDNRDFRLKAPWCLGLQVQLF